MLLTKVMIEPAHPFPFDYGEHRVQTVEVGYLYICRILVVFDSLKNGDSMR